MTTQEWRAGVKKLLPEWLVQRRLEASSPRRLLLTFDDGPSPSVTPRVLELLARHRARAVFFVVGQRVEEAPEIVEAIVRAGHIVGNHTHRHPNDHEPSFDDYLADLRDCQAAVSRVAPQPWLFRPPRGQLSVSSLAASRMLGLRLVHWSLNVRDWKCRTPADAVDAAAAFMRDVEPGQIAVLHDNNPSVVDILAAILPELEARGFDLGGGLQEMSPE